MFIVSKNFNGIIEVTDNTKKDNLLMSCSPVITNNANQSTQLSDDPPFYAGILDDINSNQYPLAIAKLEVLKSISAQVGGSFDVYVTYMLNSVEHAQVGGAIAPIYDALDYVEGSQPTQFTAAQLKAAYSNIFSQLNTMAQAIPSGTGNLGDIELLYSAISSTFQTPFAPCAQAQAEINCPNGKAWASAFFANPADNTNQYHFIDLAISCVTANQNS